MLANTSSSSITRKFILLIVGLRTGRRQAENRKGTALGGIAQLNRARQLRGSGKGQGQNDAVPAQRALDRRRAERLAQRGIDPRPPVADPPFELRIKSGTA